MKWLRKINNLIVSLYLLFMLGFFPLYYRYQYAEMGERKYTLFLYASVACVVICGFLCLVERIEGGKYPAGKKVFGNPLDFVVLLYLCTVVISFICTDFKAFAWKGAAGWFMGLCSQLLLVAVYFIIAKVWTYRLWAILLLGISSVLVYVIAVLHRFDVDLFPIYGDLEEHYKVLFLSTIGQSSWYSGFLCTIFPLGLFFFFYEKDKKKRILAGIYSAIAMMSLVTQNTDTAFLSLFVVILLLFYLSFEGKEKEFLEVIMLVLGSFAFMGICQKLFADRMISLDKLSLFMSQSVWIWIALAVVAGLYYWRCQKGGYQKSRRTVFEITIISVAATVLLTLIFIILNTGGLLQQFLGYQSTNNYLLFNEQWGNGRGFAWIFATETFGELFFIRKLFGVGPDCFSIFIASVPRYSERMAAFWGELVLTNAHNEYLTKLCTIGIAGLVAYVLMLISAYALFMKNRHKNPLLPSISLCIASYMTYLIFCYEQVCCTPFFYILLGIGSNLIYNSQGKKTY